jgi:hypothetical protein
MLRLSQVGPKKEKSSQKPYLIINMILGTTGMSMSVGSSYLILHSERDNNYFYIKKLDLISQVQPGLLSQITVCA